jgi:hypothetical protein
LTAVQFQNLAAIPPEFEWFANLTNPHTRRAYQQDITDFQAFAGLCRPEEFRDVTRAHVIAWRQQLTRQGLANDTIRRKLAASRTGLFQAFNLRRDLSNEWHRLKQANAAPMTLQLDNLPFFVRKHTPALDKVTWPVLFVMSVDGAPFNLNRDMSLNNLCIGSSNLVTLGTPFILVTPNAADLEEMVVLLHYSITN